VSDVVADVLALVRTPPSGFVAERNRLVKQLRASGDTELAAALAALRRPPLTDWALNVAAAEQPDAVAALADAAEAMAAAQEAAMDGRDAGAMRAAMPRLRDQATAVVKIAATIARRGGQTGAGSSTAALGARLTEIVADPVALEQLARGVLGVGDATLAGLDLDAPRPPRPSVERPPPASRSAPEPVHDELATRRAAEARRRRAAAEAAHAAAERSVAKREKEVAAARVVALAAEGRLAAANADLEEAIVELAEAEQRRDEAGRALAELDADG
jgi:hypothetical protein